MSLVTATAMTLQTGKNTSLCVLLNANHMKNKVMN